MLTNPINSLYLRHVSTLLRLVNYFSPFSFFSSLFSFLIFSSPFHFFTSFFISFLHYPQPSVFRFNILFCSTLRVFLISGTCSNVQAFLLMQNGWTDLQIMDQKFWHWRQWIDILGVYHCTSIPVKQIKFYFRNVHFFL